MEIRLALWLNGALATRLGWLAVFREAGHANR